MKWHGFRHQSIKDAGARFREEHSRFLTLALRSSTKYPRIPAKRVDLGGFSGLMKLSDGEIRTTQWWTKAFDRLDNP